MAKKLKKKDECCAWRKYSPFKCDPKNCDFKTLKFEKKAILKRIADERKWIKTYMEDGGSMIGVMDKLIGIGIMSKVLRDEFSVPESELEWTDLSLHQRLMLAQAYAQWRRKYGGS